MAATWTLLPQRLIILLIVFHLHGIWLWILWLLIRGALLNESLLLRLQCNQSDQHCCQHLCVCMVHYELITLWSVQAVTVVVGCTYDYGVGYGTGHQTGLQLWCSHNIDFSLKHKTPVKADITYNPKRKRCFTNLENLCLVWINSLIVLLLYEKKSPR